MKFSANSNKSNEEEVKRIGRYLKATKKEGIIYHFDYDKEIEWFVNVDFVGT